MLDIWIVSSGAISMNARFSVARLMATRSLSIAVRRECASSSGALESRSASALSR